VTLSLEEKIKVRNTLYSHKEYIDQFIENENAQKFNNDEPGNLDFFKKESYEKVLQTILAK
jgi:hypothetical protein